MSDNTMYLRNAESVLEDVAEVSLVREGRGLAFHTSTNLSQVDGGTTVKMVTEMPGKDPLIGNLHITNLKASPTEALVDQEFRDSADKLVFTRQIHQWDVIGVNSNHKTTKIDTIYKGVLGDVTIRATCAEDGTNHQYVTCNEIVLDANGTKIGTIKGTENPVDHPPSEDYSSKAYDLQGHYLGTVRGAIHRQDGAKGGSITLDVLHEASQEK